MFSHLTFGLWNQSIPIFGCDKGWHNIIIAALNEINTLMSQTRPDEKLHVYQIKEKFGGLRMYIEVLPTETDFNNKVAEIVSHAEIQCEQTCEVCGAYGWLDHKKSWIKTVCREHGHEN